MLLDDFHKKSEAPTPLYDSEFGASSDDRIWMVDIGSMAATKCGVFDM